MLGQMRPDECDAVALLLTTGVVRKAVPPGSGRRIRHPLGARSGKTFVAQVGGEITGSPLEFNGVDDESGFLPLPQDEREA
jgi:hypothetical protein